MYRFATLPKLVATADLVVLGTVTGIEPGRTVGPEDEEIQYQDAMLRIEELLKGTASKETVAVETLDIAYTNAGGAGWRDEGTRVLAFLAKSSDAREMGKYHAINITQSIYVVDGEGLDETAASDTFADEVASLTLPEVKVAIEDAKALIERGAVVPQRPRQPAA